MWERVTAAAAAAITTGIEKKSGGHSKIRIYSVVCVSVLESPTHTPCYLIRVYVCHIRGLQRGLSTDAAVVAVTAAAVRIYVHIACSHPIPGHRPNIFVIPQYQKEYKYIFTQYELLL